jgi:hypothetical protein
LYIEEIKPLSILLDFISRKPKSRYCLFAI